MNFIPDKVILPSNKAGFLLDPLSPVKVSAVLCNLAGGFCSSKAGSNNGEEKCTLGYYTEVTLTPGRSLPGLQ